MSDLDQTPAVPNTDAAEKALPALEAVAAAAAPLVPQYAAGLDDGIAIAEDAAADKLEAMRRELDATRQAGELVREQLCVDLQEMSNKLAAALAAGAISQAQLQSLAATLPRPISPDMVAKELRMFPSAEFVDKDVDGLIQRLKLAADAGTLDLTGAQCLAGLRFLLDHYNDGDEAATKAKEEADGAAQALKNAEELHGGAIEAKDLEIKDLKKELAAAEKRADDAETRAQAAEDDKAAAIPLAQEAVQANEDARVAAENALFEAKKQIATLTDLYEIAQNDEKALKQKITETENAFAEAKRLLDVMTAKVHEGEQERDDAAARANAKLDDLRQRFDGSTAETITYLERARADAAEARAELATLKAERAALNDKLGPIVRAWVGVVAPKLRAFEANGNDPQNVAGDLVADTDVKAALAVTP